MDTGVIVACITASASIVVAALSYWQTKRHELAVKWQDEKLNHYKVLFAALSDLAIVGKDWRDANMRFALACNTIALVAPQYVIKAMMDFQYENRYSNPNRSDEKHHQALKAFVLAVRRDIGRSSGDDSRTFDFMFISIPPEEKR